MPSIISYSDAISASSRFTKRHLLLGNGFSIACVPTIFSYNSLFEETNLDSNQELKKTFENLHTTDFELVIEALDKAAIILPAYNTNSPDTALKMKADAQKLKEILIETIASRHPKYPSEIEDGKYIACRKFLADFIKSDVGNRGRIYTLNYDLLLYWTLMHETENESFELDTNDGFGLDVDVDQDGVHFSEYLSWQGKSEGQTVHFLHGALHIFDSGHQVEKFAWTDTGVPLIEQCREALTANKFPLFVSEGNHEKKLQKITHNQYLFNSYENFEAIVNGGRSHYPGNTCIFTYGVSFSNNDTHILNSIAKGKIKQMYVGIYGDSNSEINRNIFNKMEFLKAKRIEFPIEICYYDSSSAKVWG